MWAHPWLVNVEVLKTGLFLAVPVHVALLVHDGVPPDIKKAIGPGAAPDEEAAKVEATAVLGNDHID